MPKDLTRAERKEIRKAKKKEKSIKLKNKFLENNPPKEPKIQFIPDLEKIPTLGIKLENLYIPKQPRVIATGSRFGLKMSWCARNADQEGGWTWEENRAWTNNEWDKIILRKLNDLEGLDWSEIQNQTSDSGHLMHYDQEIIELCDEAIERWLELDYDQYDTVFRFRLGNKKRSWGIVLQGHFFMIWYERYHKICPVVKKHT